MFAIHKSKLIEKNKQIGVELTDTLIGMIRMIIELASVSELVVAQVKLDKIKVTLYALDKLQMFFSTINLFELSAQDHLTKNEFDNYVKLFRTRFNYLVEDDK